MKILVAFLWAVSMGFTAQAEDGDVFSSTDLYVDLNQPFYRTYEKGKVSLGIAMVGQVWVEVGDGTVRTEVMRHRPLLRDAFNRVLDRHDRITFVSAERWEGLAQEATDEFNNALEAEGCYNCVKSVLFPAGIIPEG